MTSGWTRVTVRLAVAARAIVTARRAVAIAGGSTLLVMAVALPLRSVPASAARTPTITSVTFSGTTSFPEPIVTVRGQGFGKVIPAAFSNASNSCGSVP